MNSPLPIATFTTISGRDALPRMFSRNSSTGLRIRGFFFRCLPNQPAAVAVRRATAPLRTALPTAQPGAVRYKSGAPEWQYCSPTGALVQKPAKPESRLFVRFFRVLLSAIHAHTKAWSKPKHVPRISEAGA